MRQPSAGPASVCSLCSKAPGNESSTKGSPGRGTDCLQLLFPERAQHTLENQRFQLIFRHDSNSTFSLTLETGEKTVQFLSLDGTCLSVPLAQARGVKFRPSLVIQAATDTVTPGVPCHITLLCAPRYLQSPYFMFFSSYHLILSCKCEPHECKDPVCPVVVTVLPMCRRVLSR